MSLNPNVRKKGQSGLLSEEELREPRMYRVLLHNDDYTTMEFVILVLVDIFRKTAEEASEIMLSVHRNGMGVCGRVSARSRGIPCA